MPEVKAGRSNAPQDMIWEVEEHKPVIEGLDAAGRPDPAYAAALGLVRAPFGRRAASAVIDAAIWFVVQLPLWFGAVPLLLKFAAGTISLYGFVNHPDFRLSVIMAAVTVVLSLAFAVVQLVLQGVRGLTIGKAITGLRLVSVRTLERAGVGAVLLRFLVLVGASLVPLLGVVFLLSPLFDPEGRGRGWHDRASRVWLVDVRNGLNPLDEKRMRLARKMVKADPVPERSALPSLATPVGPTAAPAYRPGSRISAGVLGVARPHAAPGGLEAPATPTMTPLAPVAVPDPTPVPDPAPVPTAAPPQTPVAPVASPAPVAPPQTPAAPPAPAPQPTVAAQPTVAPQPAQPPAAPQPTVAPQPAQPPAAPQTPSAAPVARYALRLDTGESIPVVEAVLLGRNPDASGHPDARPLPLADASKSLSKTHLLVRPVAAGFEITDCGSTNGSGLIRDGIEYAAPAGAPVPVRDGDTIRMGDRLATVVAL
ncbi:RDD family protein [Microbacterium sp. USTB-Y]|uniref:RDD family protein n=1 Tax=Microbacterium sp. USTB-Y TaxID=2823692 RepID=UPI002041CDD6|nr:RDD family protein [Microbacterium sp. USTB-Y]